MATVQCGPAATGGRDNRRLELAALRIVAETVGEGLSLEATVERCLDRTLACLGLDFGCIYLRRHNYYVRLASHGLGLPQGPNRLLEAGDHRWLARPFVAQSGADPERAPSDLRGKSWMAVPLRMGTELVGAMLLGGYGCGAAGLPPVVSAQRVAGHLAVAIDNAQRQQQVRELLDDTTDIIFRTDAQGRFVYLNNAWEDLFGESIVTALGRRVTSCLPATHRRDYGTGLAALIPDGQESWRCQVPFVHPEGEPVWVEVHARLVRDDLDQVVGAAGVMRDVSQLVRQSEELASANTALRLQAVRLQEANLELSRLDQLKTEFLANVSHELRTPMSVIKGYAELLLDGVAEPLLPGQAEYLEIIGEHGEHLESLILQLLDFARISAGDIAVEVQPIPLRPVLEAARARLAISAAEAGIRLCPPRGPEVPPVLAEPGRLEQASLCLLDNAVKFGRRGGTVWCELSVVNRPEPHFGPQLVAGEPTWVQVTIRDNGVGLATTAGPELFEPFTQGDGSDVRQHGGLGIGLGLGRALVELMGGQIALQSDGPDQGTQVAFTLPLAPAAG